MIELHLNPDEIRKLIDNLTLQKLIDEDRVRTIQNGMTLGQAKRKLRLTQKAIDTARKNLERKSHV